MSLNSPFFFRFEGIEMKRPLGPWMTFRSETRKQSSRTIETYALSFSSSTGKTFTWVMSIANLREARFGRRYSARPRVRVRTKLASG